MTKAEFEARIVSMQDTLYRVSASILHGHSDREDAIQETIFKALRKREKLRDDGAMKSWVTRILVNECYLILRRQKRERPREILPEPKPQPGADPEAFELLFALDDSLRLPMVLYYVEGYSVKEIAGILRVSQGTVKSRMARARRLMKAELTQKEAQSTCRT